MTTITPFTVQNGASVTQTIAAVTIGGNFQFINSLADVNGNIVTVFGANGAFGLTTCNAPSPNGYGNTPFVDLTLGSAIQQIKSTTGTISNIDVYNPQSTGTFIFIWFAPSSGLTLTTAVDYIFFCPATSGKDLQFAFPLGGTRNGSTAGSGLSIASYSNASGTGGSSESVVCSVLYA